MPYPPRMLVRASGVDQLNPSRGAQLLVSRRRSPVDERRDDRVELVDAADVVDVGIDFVADAEVQRQPRMDAPVVLRVAGDVHVVGVGNHQILVGLAAPQRHREQQVVVVDRAVAVAIERREVLDELDAPVAEDAEIELRADALHLAAELPLMRAALQRQRRRRTASAFCVVPCGTRNEEPASRLGNVSWTPGATGVMALSKLLKLTLNSLTARGESTRVHDASTACRRLLRLLPLRRGANRAIERARRDVVLALARVADRHVVVGRGAPVEPERAEQIVERRRRERARRSICDAVSRAPTSTPPSWLRTSTEPNANRRCRRSGPPSVNGRLLPIERRIAGHGRVDRRRQRLPALVAQVDRRRSVHDVAARFRHHVDDRCRRPAELGGEAVRRDLKLLHGVLRDVLQRPADDVVVVVHAVDQ